VKEELMHSRLNETMSFVEDKRRQLLDSVNGVSGDRLSQRTAPDGWSVAEILEHLRMVEAGIARLITKRVGEAKEAGLGEETLTTSVMPSFDRHQEMLESAVLQSPPAVRPRPDIDVTQALGGLQSSRDALRAAVVLADGLSLGEIKHNHPILGELDLYQWLIFLGQHESRHKKQIERTLQSIPE
jgi:hypothetical protein